MITANTTAPLQPLRIAMLSIHSSPLGPLGTRNTGGMSVYVRELARWLGNWGHRVDIFTCVPSDIEMLSLYPNVRLIHLPPGDGEPLAKEPLPSELKGVFSRLEAYRRDNNRVYDLIHSHYWISGVVGAMAQTRWCCPHLTTFHTLGIVKNLTRSGENESDARIAHERWLAKAVDTIVVPAAREKDHLVSHYKSEPRKIHVIPCGVNLELFNTGNRAAARQRIGLAPDRDAVLYVGRFAPLKGINALFEAVADLSIRMPRLHLVVVGGDGPEAEGSRALMRLAAELAIQDRVTFAGRVDHEALATYYNACDLLAVPSHYESFGLVVLEALACGAPVVTTPVGAVETIIQPGLNGHIVNESRRDDIAHGINRILSVAPDRRPDPARIRATVSHGGWDRIASVVFNLYDRLIKENQTPAPAQPMTACCTFSN